MIYRQLKNELYDNGNAVSSKQQENCNVAIVNYIKRNWSKFK